MSAKVRLCACGCGEPVPEAKVFVSRVGGNSPRIYATQRCATRLWRRENAKKRTGHVPSSDRLWREVARTRRFLYGDRRGRLSLESVRDVLQREHGDRWRRGFTKRAGLEALAERVSVGSTRGDPC